MKESKEDKLIRRSGISNGSPTVELNIVTRSEDGGTQSSETLYLRVSRDEWNAIRWVLGNVIFGANRNSSLKEDGEK